MESVSETWRVTMFWIDKECHVYTFTVVYILASMLLHLASKCRHYRGRHFAFSKITKYKQRKNIQYKSTSYDLNSSNFLQLSSFWFDCSKSWVSALNRRVFYFLPEFKPDSGFHTVILKNCGHNLCVILPHLPHDHFNVIVTLCCCSPRRLVPPQVCWPAAGLSPCTCSLCGVLKCTVVCSTS